MLTNKQRQRKLRAYPLVEFIDGVQILKCDVRWWHCSACALLETHPEIYRQVNYMLLEGRRLRDIAGMAKKAGVDISLKVLSAHNARHVQPIARRELMLAPLGSRESESVALLTEDIVSLVTRELRRRLKSKDQTLFESVALNRLVALGLRAGEIHCAAKGRPQAPGTSDDVEEAAYDILRRELRGAPDLLRQVTEFLKQKNEQATGKVEAA